MLSRLLCCFILSVLTLVASAQMPSLKTDGMESGDVYLQKLDVEVSINGPIATTVWTMTFKNTTKRILEGELNFPLPEGVSVSRYALDINGKMREAVPVEKEKATQVFENTERRRIDPGLLEKVDGNTFRTRIYPIGASGVRTVRIGYDQELSWEEAADLRYRLPLAFQRPLESFTVNITVAGAGSKPQLEEDADGALQFEEWRNAWSAKKEWRDYEADKPIAFRIPQSAGTGAIQMQAVGNHYFFVASLFPNAKPAEKPMPKQMGLLWDVSLSGLHRDHAKEFELLNSYFSRIGNVELSLIEFSNTVSGVTRFDIRGGDWKELRKALENAVYDGGTQFGALNLTNYPVDEFLLVSDGHSSFGSDQMQVGDKPVYAIAASAGADFPFLRSIARRSGGELVDLTALPVAKARALLCTQPLHFLGVKATEGVEECYPSLPTPVTGALTVAGMVYQPVKTVILQFGYGKKVTMEVPVSLDAVRHATTSVELGRVWAQKKIAELDERYNDNQLEIRHLGRSYGIVTRNTSLVVLENIMDYVAYEIEPPLELREEYDRIMKGREDNDRWRRRQVADQAEQYFNELFAWWNTKAPAVAAKQPLRNDAVVERNMQRETQVRMDTVPMADRMEYAAPALQGSVAGVQVQRNSNAMNEVVVIGYGSAKRKSVTGAVSGSARLSEDADMQRNAGGNDGGPERGSFTVLKAEASTRYLEQLKGAARGDRYALYLKLRKDYLDVPLFYFHVAEFFLGAGEKGYGIRVLSNIAELDAENYELYKMMAYKLKEAGETGAACASFRKILEWRPFEPQSYRDYGLALEDAGLYQNALDTLYLAMTKNYDQSISALYPGIEETLLPEINELIARHKSKLRTGNVPQKLIAEMPVDMRVVLNWNRNSTDIDLWVTDPDNERCYYGHRSTAMGGRISHDFTRGLGPEQFLLKKAVKGRYKVEVNYYGDTQVKLAGETTLLVEVYTHYGTPQQQRSLVTLQMKPGSKGGVYVGDFEF